jgi:hypothetical protein
LKKHIFVPAATVHRQVRIIYPHDFEPILLDSRKNNVIRAVIFLTCPVQGNPGSIFAYRSATNVDNRSRELVIWRSGVWPLFALARKMRTSRQDEATDDRNDRFLHGIAEYWVEE